MMSPDDTPIQKLAIHTAHASSAFDKVPPETIVEIFHFCLPTYPLEYRQPDTTIAPMLLCQVSSLWRSIAINTPTLWIYLNHVGYVASEDFLAAQILPKAIWPIETAFLKWWTANLQSAHAVVHLELDVSKIESRNQSMAGNLFDDEVSFERLIRNARGLYLEQTLLISFWRRSGRFRLDSWNLRSIFIDQKNMSANLTGGSQNDLDAIPIRFSNNLKRFIKHGYIFHVPLYPQPQDRIPWAGLTHISIRTLLVTATEWYTLIRRFFSLQVGEFHTEILYNRYEQTPFDSDTSQSRISLVHVETLNLCIKEYSLQFNPLHNLTLPNITHLAIYITDTNLDIVGSIVQSCPRLQDLRLASQYMRLDSPSNILTGRLWDSVPELQSLTVDINEVIYDIDLEEALRTLGEWINVLSASWLCLEDPPASFQRLSFTTFKEGDEILGIKSEIRAQCELLGLPPRVEVDVHRTVDADWNFSATELRSWM